VAARLEAEAPKRGASFADRLRHALTLEALGLSEESRALWRDLARERPGEPAVQERAQP
jgi:CelD/BcsL family acetyltransferase involved in cellulose biosynthesis